MFKQCCQKYILEPENNLDLHYFNYQNGDLHVNFSDPTRFDRFCVDFTVLEGQLVQSTYVCFEDYREIEFYIYGWSLCFSSVFLVLTIVVYICSPRVRGALSSINKSL